MTELEYRYNLPVLTDRTYCNPLKYDDGSLPTNADPFITRYRGRYYCFSSGRNGVNLSTSLDLVTWRALGMVLSEPDRCEYWAPCMARINGRFYLYYSSRPAGSDDPHHEALHVAVSDVIEGPYTVEHRFFDIFAIDPHVVRDRAGDWVMFYSTNEPTGLHSENAGTAILVDRLVSPTQLAGRPRVVVLPSIEEEIFERNRFGSGRDWYTIEGASYFRHHDSAYLTYSGNAYVGENYFIGYSSADLRVDDAPAAAEKSCTPIEGIGDLRWQKFPNDYDHEPLVRRNETVEGTGHNSIVTGPNLVDDWIAYHGRDCADPIIEGTEQRVMRIDPVFYSGGTLNTCAPSWQVQDAPALPTIADPFVSENGLGEAWTVVEGVATIDGAALVTSATSNVLVVHSHRTDAYVAEVWLQASRTDSGARAGVVPWYLDEDNFVEACLDAFTSRVIVTRRENGFVSVIGTWPIDRSSLQAWSIIHIERTFDTISLRVDDRAAGTFSVPAMPAFVGLRAIRTRADFSAFALTDHVALYGKRMRYLPRLFGASSNAALSDEGVGSPSRRTVSLVGSSPAIGVATTYEFVLQASWSVVTLQPIISGGDDVRIRLDVDGYRIDVCRGGVSTLVSQGRGRRSRHLSVRTLSTLTTVVVRIGDATVVIDFPVGGDTTGTRERCVDLIGARLRSLDQTSTTFPHHPVVAAKEQK